MKASAVNFNVCSAGLVVVELQKVTNGFASAAVNPTVHAL
jgi:hypothetical protein